MGIKGGAVRGIVVAATLAAVLGVPGHAQGDDDFEFDLDDELDALIGGELVEEAGPAPGLIRSVQGFGELAARSYFRDRSGPRNDAQILLRGELELDLDLGEDVDAYLRPRFLVDLLDGDYQRFEPFEAYATWSGEDWDLRAGSMVENWGIVDTYNPVDVFNRRDFGSDLLDTDRLGEVGVRYRKSFEGNDTFGEPTLSAYVLPVWQRTRFAPEDQRFSIQSGGIILDEDSGFEPSGSERMFYGLRGQSTLSTSWINADLQLVFADGPSRFPGIQSGGGVLAPAYFGARVVGAGIRAVPNEDALGSEWAKYTLKAEVAHTSTSEFDGATSSAPADYTAWVVGVDRVFDNVITDQDNLTATLEYAWEAGGGDAQSTFRPFRNDLVLRALWDRNDFDRTSLEARVLFDIDDEEWVGELRYETQLRRWHEDVKFGIQLQVFDPADPGQSLFGLFPDNSSLLFSLRFDF